MNPQEIQLVRTRVSEVFNILQQARNEAIDIPDFSKQIRDNPFSGLSSVEDLPNIKNAKAILSFFHYFFPHRDGVS